MQPENILLDAKGNVKLTDYGLAKDFTRVPHNRAAGTGGGSVAAGSGDETCDVDDDTSYIMRTNSVCGTHEYMAPETIDTSISYNGSVDW